MSRRAADTSPLPRRRRWPWVLLSFLTLLYFLPWIVAHTGLFDWIVHKAVGPLNGKLVVKQASLGWFSPITLGEVEIQDERGTTVLRIERAETTKTLWSFLWNRQDLGILRITGADIDLVLQPGGSNLETVLKPFLADLRAEESSGGSAPELTLEVKASSVTLTEKGSHVGTLKPVDMTLALNTNQQTPFDLTLQIKNALGGTLSARLMRDAEATNDVPWSLSINGDAFSLAPLNAVFTRFDIQTRLAGELSGKADVRWNDGSVLKADIVSTLQVRDGWIEGIGLQDRLTLKSLACPAQFQIHGSRIQARKLEVKCDVGSVNVAGAFDLEDWRTSLEKNAVDAQVELDLVKLSEKLPRTLHLHQDLTLTSGTVKLDASSKLADKGMRWIASLHAANLKGKRGGREVTWKDPIKVEGDVRIFRDSGFFIERLDCASGFLKLQGRGNLGALSVDAEADLARLSASLGDFVDLGNVQLKGQATLKASMTSLPSNDRQAKAELQVKDWQVHWPGTSPWREAKAFVKVDAAGRWNETYPVIHSASLTWESGSDRAQATLRAPLDLANASTGDWMLNLQGQLDRWQRRIELVTGAWPGWHIAGYGEIKGSASPRGEAWSLTNLSFLVSDARITGPGLWINEPTLDVEGRATLSTTSLKWDAAQLRCPSINANAAHIVLDWTKDFEMAGGLSMSADLSRVRRWFIDPALAAPMPIRGLAIGQMGIRSARGKVSFDANASVQNLVVGKPADPLFRDPNLKLQAKGGWDAAKDACSFEHLSLESQTLACSARGKIDRVSTVGLIDLKGKLSYDLKKMEPMLHAYLGKEARIEGKDQRDFYLTGPLFQPDLALGAKAEPTATLKGEASFHWDKLSAYRCDIGRGEVKLSLENGSIALAPFESSLNSGKLRLQAKLKPSPAPAELWIPKSNIIERAQITPAMCSGGLGYVLPALAGVTEAEGLLSFDLEHGQIPLASPDASNVLGILTLHDVRIGPSPILRELSMLFKGPAPAKIKKEARVTIHMINNRIHHEKLELIFPDFTIRTYGWVGLDGSLDLIAEVPVSGSWVGGDRLGKALEGRTISVPIKGTLDRPQLDQRTFQAALAKLVRDTTGTVIRNELEDRLKKLLVPGGK